MVNVEEMDAAKLQDLLWSISQRFLELHKACPKGAYERDALWEAGYRISVASEKAAEILDEGELK